jgi:hypothetical protein
MRTFANPYVFGGVGVVNFNPTARARRRSDITSGS